ncbi:hypothetical protein RRG08_065735 [Elysia crispata]|uniref:Uncharacterized protein n=1 Tax=Elysia crispata TaxID=231223 RepID=A0AAE1DAW2_9GAST|nr:hypothetical protein RRG08_065735 [Elysia crispata]
MGYEFQNYSSCGERRSHNSVGTMVQTMGAVFEAHGGQRTWFRMSPCGIEPGLFAQLDWHNRATGRTRLSTRATPKPQRARTKPGRDLFHIRSAAWPRIWQLQHGSFPPDPLPADFLPPQQQQLIAMRMRWYSQGYSHYNSLISVITGQIRHEIAASLRSSPGQDVRQ